MILLAEEKRVRLWQDYMATAMGMIGRTLAGESWTLPLYVEMAYPEVKDTDTRTADEIKSDIIKRLTGVNPEDAGKEVTESNATA